MDKVISTLTVFFEEPFWVCVFERETNGRYEVCKITFGAEPKDYEVYDFMLKNYCKLRFSPSIEVKSIGSSSINPKRMQREIKKQMQNTGVGTKAQQAFNLQHEQFKEKRQTVSKSKKEEQKQRQFELKHEKRKEKHRGH